MTAETAQLELKLNAEAKGMAVQLKAEASKLTEQLQAESALREKTIAAEAAAREAETAARTQELEAEREFRAEETAQLREHTLSVENIARDDRNFAAAQSMLAMQAIGATAGNLNNMVARMHFNIAAGEDNEPLMLDTDFVWKSVQAQEERNQVAATRDAHMDAYAAAIGAVPPEAMSAEGVPDAATDETQAADMTVDKSGAGAKRGLEDTVSIEDEAVLGLWCVVSSEGRVSVDSNPPIPCRPLLPPRRALRALAIAETSQAAAPGCTRVHHV